jgi:hypothetical protein
MPEQEESKKKHKLTSDQKKELMAYPSYWRASLQEAVELNGGSIKEAYERSKDLEAFL